MTLQKNPPVRDPKHLAKVREMSCVVCGATPCDPAHIRHGLGGGMGMKPGDDLVLPLCHAHHMEQHRIGELRFWDMALSKDDRLMMNCVKALAKYLYRKTSQ
jgi:hypothetical protein